MGDKVALVTGATGQDGAYLIEFLLERGYTVHGIKRRSSSFNTERIDHIFQDPHEDDLRFILHYGDMTDATNLIRIIQQVQPDEIYNLAAQSHVKVSFETAEYTANADALGPLRLLEAIRLLGLHDKTRFYQASSSEMFGKVMEVPQKETTPFYPRSPYAAAKVYAYWITVNYREAYDLFACNGILFNHESPVRGETFVTRKITRAAARIALGVDQMTRLGNLDATRDWGHARDYVRAMWLMLQQDRPDDFVIATGRSVSVRDFARLAFAEVGLELAFEGTGLDERGVIGSVDAALFEDRVGQPPGRLEPGTAVVEIDPRYFRPTEVEQLLGDPSKARAELGWEPECTLEQMVAEMVAGDLARSKREKLLRDHGHRVVSGGHE